MKAIHAAQPLFAWAELEDYPTLATLRNLLHSVPDQPLVDGLQAARGKGRDDFPLPCLWRIVLLTIALRHAHINDTLAELHRDPSLCRLLDITTAEQIPHDWNLSRFLDVSGQPPHRDKLRAIFDHLFQRLGLAVPDLGRDSAGDSTTLNARPKTSAQAVRYRCPALHESWDCPSQSKCSAGRSYGLTVRVPCALDLRRFPPIPRATKEFERRYKGRTSVERVNGRLKVFWGADDGNVTGARRFHAFVGVVMVVHGLFALLLAQAPRWEGRLRPIAEALRQPPAA